MFLQFVHSHTARRLIVGLSEKNDSWWQFIFSPCAATNVRFTRRAPREAEIRALEYIDVLIGSNTLGLGCYRQVKNLLVTISTQ